MGLIVVVSSPSGGGKTTVVNALLERNRKFVRSVSYTTRPIKASEKHGGDYHFVSESEFRRLVKGGFFAEYADVHGYLYGTPKHTIKRYAASGKDAFFVIDVKGGLAVKKLFPDAVLVFVAPPGIKELKKRLNKRNRETPGEIRRRILRMKFEFGQGKKYDYCIINDKIACAVADLEGIVRAERNASKYRKIFLDRLIKKS